MSGSIAGPVVLKSRIDRKLGIVPYQAGTTQMLRLDADGLLLALKLRLRYRVTGGGSNAVGPKAYALFGILRRVELLINSVRTLISTNGLHLAVRQHIETGVRPTGSDATVVLTSATATDYDVTLLVPMYLPRAVSPWDTGLDMRAVQQAVLQIAWGNETDIFVTPNGATVSNVQLDVEGLFKHNAGTTPAFVRELVEISQDVSATNTDLGVMLDRGAYFLRSLNVLSVSDSVLVNTMLDAGNITLKSGNMPFVDRAGASVRYDQSHMYGLALAERITGLYRLEMPMLGESSTMINMAALTADMYARFNVTKVGTADKLLLGIERLAQHP